MILICLINVDFPDSPVPDWGNVSTKVVIREVLEQKMKMLRKGFYYDVIMNMIMEMMTLHWSWFVVVVAIAAVTRMMINDMTKSSQKAYMRKSFCMEAGFTKWH